MFGHVCFTWCKGHATVHHLQTEDITPWYLRGNYIADNLAEAGARANALPTDVCDSVGRVDARAWIIQKRLVAINMRCAAKHNKDKHIDRVSTALTAEERKRLKMEKEAKLEELLERSEHLLARCGNTWRCRFCLESCPHDKLNSWLMNSP